MANAQVLTADEQRNLLILVSRVFSPAAPINKAELFAGRVEQLKRVSRAINTRGQHAIIFGERGVGKTSLASILKEMIPSQGSLVVKVNCVDGDTFDSVWRRAFDQIQYQHQTPAAGFNPGVKVEMVTLSSMINHEIGSADILKFTSGVIGNSGLHITFIFDEFDRLPYIGGQCLFADTVKDLADNSDNTTLVLVGVGQNVDELIKEHASIDRNLVQIKMPRMGKSESKEIVVRALKTLNMTIDPHTLDMIVFLSQGLPHYTHLLGQESSTAAIEKLSSDIDPDAFKKGITEAIKNSQQSVTSAYQKAISSPKKNNLFATVLLASALSETDEFGYFTSASVRDPLNKITGQDYDIPNFGQHLDKFSGDDTRGPVLEKAGTTRRFRYKFRNPLLQPYVIMKGLMDGVMSGELLDSMAKTMSFNKKEKDSLF